MLSFLLLNPQKTCSLFQPSVFNPTNNDQPTCRLSKMLMVAMRQNMAMYRKMWTIFAIFLGIISIVNAGGDTLVLLDNLAIKETHSMFFKSLQGWL